MKELVLLALHASVSAADFEAIRRHVERAQAAGSRDKHVMAVLLSIVRVANHAL